MFSLFGKKIGSSEDESPSKSNSIWIFSTLVLLILFGGFLIYSFQPASPTTPNPSQNPPEQNTPKGPVVTLPITLVYNQSLPEQKQDIQVFLDSLTNPKTGLQSTAVKDTWFDFQSAEGKKYIEESEAVYLPVAFFDKTIEQHPQFQSLAPYLQKKGDNYYFHLRPLQHIKGPPVTGGNVKGVDPSKAKVTILEYGSYTCHYCRDMEAVLKRILSEFGDKVTLVYKNFDRGGYDNLIAQSAECAGEQQNYWQMHDLLFSHQDALIQAVTGQDKDGKTSPVPADKRVRDYLEKEAKNLGGDFNVKNFLSCLDSKKHQKKIDEMTREAIKYGINGTPGFFINQKFSDGASNYEDFKAMVEGQLTINN